MQGLGVVTLHAICEEWHVVMAEASSHFVWTGPFTYQSKADIGWLALGNALAAAGIRPLRAWPMLSDTGSGLHKHPNSISWDCVLHCDLHGQRDSFTFSKEVEEPAKKFVAFWHEAVRKEGGRLSSGDEANLYCAGALVAALGPANPRGYRRRAKATSF